MSKRNIITVPNTVRISKDTILEAGDRIEVLTKDKEELQESDYGYYRMEIQNAAPIDNEDVVRFQVRSEGGSSKWINLNAQSMKAIKDVFNL